MARLEDLPHELFREILKYLSPRDISAVSRLNKRLHWQLFEEVFQRAYERKITSRQTGTTVLITLFFHALEIDSLNLLEWILAHDGELDLNGYIPKYLKGPTTTCTPAIHWESSKNKKSPNVTYLQLAILKDTPKIVSRLVKYGTDLNADMGDYPDLTPLYMTLAQCRVSSPRALDNALRIACTYALPKTAHFLLNNMANPNSFGPLGYSALHYAVSKKIPFRRFQGISSTPWENLVATTVRTLLDFNADKESKTSNPRMHACGHKCWRSFDCDSSGQTALQLASSRGLSEAVTLLLDNGADPGSANEDGFNVLYTALAQGHSRIATQLLQCMYEKINPIVNERTGMTALHAACRFAMPDVALYLLKRGADVDAPDSHGKTPLYELLGQTCFGAEDDVLTTLDYLDEYGADPDIDLGMRLGGPRKLGENHPIPEVRVMFIKEESKECKLRFRPPKPRDDEETRSTPLVQPPPKIPKVQPTNHRRQVEGGWDPDHVGDIIKNLTATKKDPEDKPQERKKPREPRKNTPPLDSAVGTIPKRDVSKEANVLKENEKVGKDQSSLGATGDPSHSSEFNPRRVELRASQPTDPSAARFWKNLPRRQAPKVEVREQRTKTGSEEGKNQASNKSRSRKTKWKALELA